MPREILNTTKHTQIQRNTITADADGTTIDRVGYPESMIVVDVGVTAGPADATNFWELKLYHAIEDPATPDAALASDWGVVPEEQLVGALAGTTTGAFALINDAAEDAKQYRVAYIGVKRFLRVRFEATLSPGSTDFVTTHIQSGGVIPAV